MFLFFLAEKLHKSIEEIMQFSVQELKLWCAYYELQNDEQKRVMEDGRAKHNIKRHR